MKILLINSSPFCSGAELSMLQLIKDMKRHQVLAVFPLGADYLQFFPEDIEYRQLNLKWFVRSYSPIRLLGYLINIIGVASKLAKIIAEENISTVYANGFKSAIYLIPLRLVFYKLKFVCHIRDQVKNPLTKRLLSVFFHRLICISEFVYEELATIGPQKKELIYNGIELPDKKLLIRKQPDLRIGIKRDENIFVIAQIGQLTRWKHQADLIRVAKLLKSVIPEFHIIFIGDDLSGREQAYKNELSDLVRDLDVGSCVSFLGYFEKLEEIFPQIDILVHPAVDEPFGRVLIEAMAFEKPVVAYKCGGPKEIVVDNVTGFLVEPNNTEMLALRIMELCSNPALRKSFGREGRQRVIDKFNQKQCSEAFEQAIESLCTPV